MFRPMRRQAQQLPKREAESILQNASSGVLALLGDDGYPYAVPMSYVYLPGKLCFHSAAEGHKVDAIRKHAKASFCVIAQDQVQPASLTTHYRSAIAFGHLRLVGEETEKREILRQLALRYAPMHMEHAQREIEESVDHTCLIVMQIEHLTCKEARELMEKRSEKP